MIFQRPHLERVICDNCHAERADRSHQQAARAAVAEGWLLIVLDPDPDKFFAWVEWICPRCRPEFDV